MSNDIKPTPEQQLALVREAKERMNGRARSWLEESKVEATLDGYDPDLYSQKQAC